MRVGRGGPPSRRPVAVPVAPGVTRFDLVCHAQLVDTVDDLMFRWGRDRALRATAAERLVDSVRAALGHGRRFCPRRLTVLVRWQDLERVRVDLRWRDCLDAATAQGDGDDPEATIWLLDQLSVDWGVGRTREGWVHWLVVDTG